jgi:hypothetical protein
MIMLAVGVGRVLPSPAGAEPATPVLALSGEANS